MYFAGIMDHFSGASKIELIAWCSTFFNFVPSMFRIRGLLARAKSTAGDIKAGSTGPPIWAPLAMSGQVIGLTLPGLVYCTTVAYNKFRQPEWMIKYALPSPPDVFGFDGVVVWRLIGMLAIWSSSMISRGALKVLGKQFHGIGIRKKHTLCDSGPYAYVRHPLYTCSFIVATCLPLVYWSYLPLYILPITFGGHLLKVPIEEKILLEDPVLGKQYKAYMSRVPYKIIPYIW